MAKPIYIDNLEEWKRSFNYCYPITVRFSETDAFGHMNNCVSFVYFEQARINFFKKIGLAEEWFSKGGETIPVTADLQCDYMKQVFFDDSLQVYVKAETTGKTSVDLHYMIMNEKQEICMTGRGRMVQISKSTGRPVPWSETALECLRKR